MVAGLAGVAIFGMDQGGGGGRFFIMFEWLIVLLQIMGIVFVAERVRHGCSRATATSGESTPEADAQTDRLSRLLGILGRVAALAVAVTAVKLLALNYVVGPPPPAAAHAHCRPEDRNPGAGGQAARSRSSPGYRHAVRHGMERSADGTAARSPAISIVSRRVYGWSTGPIRNRDDERTLFYFVDEFDIADFPLEMVGFAGRLPEHLLGQDVVVVCARITVLAPAEEARARKDSWSSHGTLRTVGAWLRASWRAHYEVHRQTRFQYWIRGGPIPDDCNVQTR